MGLGLPYIGELIRDTDCPAVEEYNDFAEALEDIWQQDGMILTYVAVLDAERPDTLRGACELLRNLDNYQRIVEGAYGYGQQRLQETPGLDDEAIYELDGYTLYIIIFITGKYIRQDFSHIRDQLCFSFLFHLLYELFNLQRTHRIYFAIVSHLCYSHFFFRCLSCLRV